MLSDLLPILRVPYYRFNPQVPIMRLDETSPEKLSEMQTIGRQHVVAGKGKEDCAALAQLLTTGRGRPSAPPTGSGGTRLKIGSRVAAALLKIGSRVAGVRSRL